ncbi:hypothetical protein [Polaribacter sp. SA4-12]|uniref:hypothetical protein n=1 Tax=Polaribacter sp. SA4-12 TaxID=1312072 RepID=UPI000B3C058B|nr:hypothetical protein [Polaribacter sp. SA4-12]
MLAPIVLFVYNRPWHTEQTLEALMQNKLADNSILYIYCDGPKPNALKEELNKIIEVKEVVRKNKWCKEVYIIEQENNLGLADSIVKGVTEVVNNYGKIIVLEDDIVTSMGFLSYMNDALNIYEREENVMHISGYFSKVKGRLPNFFFYNQASCWGWATWKSAWVNYNGDSVGLYNQILDSNRVLEFNMNNSYPFLSHLEANIRGEMKTWAIKWHASVFLKKGLCLHPAKSFVNNIGFDNSGVHCEVSDRYTNEYLNNIDFKKPKKKIENIKAKRLVEEFNKNGNKKNIFLRLKKIIKVIYNKL